MNSMGRKKLWEGGWQTVSECLGKASCTDRPRGQTMFLKTVLEHWTTDIDFLQNFNQHGNNVTSVDLHASKATPNTYFKWFQHLIINVEFFLNGFVFVIFADSS